MYLLLLHDSSHTGYKRKASLEQIVCKEGAALKDLPQYNPELFPDRCYADPLLMFRRI